MLITFQISLLPVVYCITGSNDVDGETYVNSRMDDVPDDTEEPRSNATCETIGSFVT